MKVLWNFAKQGAGAIPWGLFYAAAPFEFVFGGCIVWLPLLIWRERLRARSYGFWPGAFLRLGIVLAIAVAAINAPKHMNEIVEPVRFENIPLAQLCMQLHREYGIRVNASEQEDYEKPISFTTTARMSRRAIVAELAKATNREQNFAGCLNGSSLLTGAYGTYYLHTKRTQLAAGSAPES